VFEFKFPFVASLDAAFEGMTGRVFAPDGSGVLVTFLGRDDLFEFCE
jgi:hypothetical protein